MKTVYQSTDKWFIKEMLAVDNAYADVCYDGSPVLSDFDPQGVWLFLFEDHTYSGFINLLPIGNVMWTPHIFIFEEYRGNGSEDWGKQAAQFMKDHYGAKKFLAITPYISARRYAERVGFKYLTEITQSIQKNGKTLDQYVLEMT